jgi:hypothetical protein
MAQKCGVYERWVLWLRNPHKQIVLTQRREIIPANSVVKYFNPAPLPKVPWFTVYKSRASGAAPDLDPRIGLSNQGQLVSLKTRAGFSDSQWI